MPKFYIPQNKDPLSKKPLSNAGKRLFTEGVPLGNEYDSKQPKIQ